MMGTELAANNVAFSFAQLNRLADAEMMVWWGLKSSLPTPDATWSAAARRCVVSNSKASDPPKMHGTLNKLLRKSRPQLRQQSLDQSQSVGCRA
jgi:hypothetical protein